MARILIGTDGSELAAHAAAQAAALLAVDEAVVVSVVRPVLAAELPAAVPGAPLAAGVLDDETTQALRAEAERAAGAIAATFGTNATTRVVEGEPGPVLCQLADEIGADVVVVGSHGSGWLRRVVLGSVSTYVVQHAPCEVLVVRASAADG